MPISKKLFRARKRVNSQPNPRRLPRSMTVFETWGFGLSGHISWFTTNPLIVIALGPSSIFVLLPATILGVLLNLLLRRLGESWPDVAGGTPNYTAALLSRYPTLGSYAAIGYWFAWVAVLPINASVLTDAIQSNLDPLGITCPQTLLKIGFTVLPYILAFGGSRALAILHLFFVVPAVGFSLLFCLQGLAWLGFSPDSPGLFANTTPQSWTIPSIVEWAKWMFFALWLTTACETTTSFVADSQFPKKTLQFMSFAAALIPVVALGTAWILVCLANTANSDASVFEIVLTAAKPFWGIHAGALVTLLLSSACLLNSATSVSVSPRILYQLAVDQQLPSVFRFVSRRGVLVPHLIVALLISLSLIGTDLSRTIIVTGVGWLSCILTLLLSVYLRQTKLKIRRQQWLKVGIVILAVVIGVGGWNWGKLELLIGLLAPAIIVTALSLIDQETIAPFQLEWWLKRDQPKDNRFTKDFVAVQVVILLVLVCGAATVSWLVKAKLDGVVGAANNDLFVIVLMTVAFVSIAVAAWTSLPQVAAIFEAQKQAENRFIAALETVPDAVLVVDEAGIVCQLNPAAMQLLNDGTQTLIDCHLSQFLPDFNNAPVDWQERSEHSLQLTSKSTIYTIEATVSQRTKRESFEYKSMCLDEYSFEYIVILRDISERKLFEKTLKNQATQLQQALDNLNRAQAQLIQAEKMSGLGQLVAGVAHEINNPTNFIHGNLDHANRYVEDLLTTLSLYQKHYPQPDPEIQQYAEEADLEFLAQDISKVLASMQEGTRRIREIVLGLRNFSRLDEAEMKQVDLHEGLNSTLLILQHRFKARHEMPEIQVVKHYADLPKVECYAGQMNQVFMNVLANALDAIDHRNSQMTLEAVQQNPGKITLTTRLEEMHQVVIQIRDNGTGIPESAKAKLFDPFFTTKPVGQGTGLGLSICYQIVVGQHGGRLDYSSTPDTGTEFVITIPLST
jgi:signal transduction histidine kinase/PAS domain-containing protein